MSDESGRAIVQLLKDDNGRGPVIFGWVGVLATLGWMFGAVPADYAIFFGFFGSSLAAVLGHHARAMGWFDGE